MDFLAIFSLQHTFQEWIAPKSLEMDRDSLHTKFSALNVVFTSLHFAPAFKEFSLWGCQTWVLPSKYSHSATRTAATTWDDGAIWRMWMHRTQRQLLGSVSLDFVWSGLSNMHCCHVYSFALARLPCLCLFITFCRIVVWIDKINVWSQWKLSVFKLVSQCMSK